MHNQLSAYGIGDDWADHIARGSAGGVDFLTPVGVPIEAPEDGYISNLPYNGTGGHTVTLIRDANHSTQFMHLSAFVPADRYVKEGEIIGYTGGARGSDGAGSSTGPHCHAHSFEFGRRVPPFFLSFAAGIPSTPPLDSKDDRPMDNILIFGTETSQDYPYIYDIASRTRHSLSIFELSLLRTAGDQPGGRRIPEVTIAQAAFDAIPKAAGSA